MISGKRWALAVVTAVVLGGAALLSPLRAEMFTSEDFLKWPRDSQGSYFRTSVGIVGLVVRRNRKPQGDCIDRWYFGDESKAHSEITDVMRKYPQYHPQGVILSLIEKKCGSTIFLKP